MYMYRNSAQGNLTIIEKPITMPPETINLKNFYISSTWVIALHVRA